MKLVFAILLVSACASAPRNYSLDYVHAVLPGADVSPVGRSSAIGRDGDIVFFCTAAPTADGSHRTVCGALADWRPTPAAKAAPPPSTAPPVVAPPSPSATPPSPASTGPQPVLPTHDALKGTAKP